LIGNTGPRPLVNKFQNRYYVRPEQNNVHFRDNIRAGRGRKIMGRSFWKDAALLVVIVSITGNGCFVQVPSVNLGGVFIILPK